MSVRKTLLNSDAEQAPLDNMCSTLITGFWERSSLSCYPTYLLDCQNALLDVDSSMTPNRPSTIRRARLQGACGVEVKDSTTHYLSLEPSRKSRDCPGSSSVQR